MRTMPTGRWWVRMAVAAVLGTALFVACAQFVRKEDRIRFSHKLHVKEQSLGCEECHAAVKESERIKASTWPRMPKCLECHEGPEGKCATCHTDPKRPRTWQRERIESVVFSHQLHLEVTEGKCDPCHKGVEEQTQTHQADRPITHEVCMECHRKDFRKIDCRMCHEDLIENPSRPTRVFSHDADFLKRHGPLAKGDEAVCSHCHRPDYCAECHSRTEVLNPSVKNSERVDAERIHRGDFLIRHPIEARLDPNACLKCHTVQTCQSCHEKRRVGARSGGASPHPQGWANRVGSPDFHGEKARRDIVACASCHDQGAASNCVGCHRVGGPGGNPHPPGFDPKGRDSAMCRACHVNGI